MTLEELIADALKSKGYQGLRHDDLDCACTLEDLMPCQEPDLVECRPAYLHQGWYCFEREECPDCPGPCQQAAREAEDVC